MTNAGRVSAWVSWHPSISKRPKRHIRTLRRVLRAAEDAGKVSWYARDA